MMTAGSRREKGTGGITRMKDGRYRAYLTITPDPADGSRRRVSAVGRTRTQALDRAKARARDIEAGRTDPKAVPTVGEWLDQWVTDAIEPRRAPNTTRSYRTRIRIDIRPLIGAIRLDMIRPSHIRRIECFASMFVRQVRQCFSAVWADGFPRCRHRFPVM